jgi:hypothetical protein
MAKTKKKTEKQLHVEAIDLWLRIGVEILRDIPEIYEEVEQHLNRRIEEILLSELDQGQSILYKNLWSKIDEG